ncbi:hypothetical protein OG758_00405 [Streptomyces sp. NBC_01474]|uniref:hypothetical protein n=1 Tax=Streptomyces sp. NBC_01474 TaxID=2903880 RepID=UPI002DD917C4|nr:hypothetical protein [Streptomyces sp. NBC_01474]WSD92825.1 hypothetical protein OG758_00405 [Streptomyces sp. NBC_01474]
MLQQTGDPAAPTWRRASVNHDDAGSAANGHRLGYATPIGSTDTDPCPDRQWRAQEEAKARELSMTEVDALTWQDIDSLTDVKHVGDLPGC